MKVNVTDPRPSASVLKATSGQAMRRFEPHADLAQTPNAQLEYIDEGPANGPVLMLVHGVPDGPATWERVMALLPDDIRVIRPSLRGVGNSIASDGAQSGQIAALASDLLELLDVLSIEEAVLVGHDWGARAAHAAAAIAPGRIRGLVTLATAYGPRSTLTPSEALDDAAVAWYRYWLCTDVGASSFAADPRALDSWAWGHWSAPGVITPHEREMLLPLLDNRQFVETVIHYYRHGATEAIGSAVYADLQAQLDQWPDINVPTIFLVGANDGCETVPAAHASETSFPAGIEIKVLNNVGHFVQREAPQAVADAISFFLWRDLRSV